jgi:hypothetical protein
MSGGGPGGGRGPGDGYYGPGYDGPGTPSTTAASSAPGSNSGSSNLPVWALVLIMVGSGLITLTFLWLCVLFICRKRRARRAAVRDLEVQTSFQSERETARILGPVHAGINKEEDAKRCESEAGVELTFVVMAGEDQPSYLAKPAPQQQTMNLTTTPGSAGDAAAKTTPEANSQLEKQTQQRSAASETPPRVVVDRKTPPSPS